MSVKRIKQVCAVAVLLVALASFSSCNRGYGCPTFSIEKGVSTAVDLYIR